MIVSVISTIADIHVDRLHVITQLKCTLWFVYAPTMLTSIICIDVSGVSTNIENNCSLDFLVNKDDFWPRSDNG